MRTNIRIELPQWVLIAAMFGLAAFFWGSAPESILVQWGISGQPDRYGGKFEGLLAIPFITLGVYLLLLFLPRLDPRRANYDQFWGVYSVMRLAVVLVLALVYGFVLLWVRGVQLDVLVVIPVLIGGLFVVIGNLMGKVRPNLFVGIRTPWTLSSKRSWVRTHRLGGWLFVLMGLALLVSGFVGSATAVILAFALVAGCVVWLFVYSYLAWRGDPDASPTGRPNSGGFA